MNKSRYYCLVCETELEATTQHFSIDELFQLWKPINFTDETISQHRKQAKETSLYLCPCCKLEIFYPQIIGTSDFYKEAYNLTGSQTNSTFTYEVDKWDFHQALKDIGSSESIVEIGCGVGRFLKLAEHRAVKVIGTEYNQEAIKIARFSGHTVFESEDQLLELKEEIDAAFSFHVLEHVADPLHFMQKICTLIKPGGHIGISVPNQKGPIKYINPCIMNMPPHHATHWQFKTFEHLAKRLNLVIKRVSYEPLLLENYSYYSYNYINSAFPNSVIFSKFLKPFASKVLRFLFKAFKRLGFKYFLLLRGQSIYVLMKKNDDA